MMSVHRSHPNRARCPVSTRIAPRKRQCVSMIARSMKYKEPVNIDSYGLRCLRDVIKEILAGKEFSVTLRGCCFCFKWPNSSV